MKAFIYKILSKGLLILLLSCLATLYYYRAQLFPEGYDMIVAEPVADEPQAVPREKVEEKLESVPASAPETMPLAEVIDPSRNSTPDLPGQDSDEAATAQGNPSAEPAIVVVQPAATVMAAVTETHADKEDNNHAPDSRVEADEVASDTRVETVLADGRDAATVEQTAEMSEFRFAPIAETSAPPPLPTMPVSEGPSSDPKALLSQARDAYWVGDYDIAEPAYQQVIALNQDDPTAYGELGNIYFAQGEWDVAADTYLQAAQLLLAQGRVAEAKHLILVLQGLNNKHADRLEEVMPLDEK